MKELLKNLGVIIVLIGAAIVAVPFMMGTFSNGLLLGGLIVMVLGIITTIVIGKNVD